MASQNNTVWFIRMGILAGMVAGVIMILYAMIASITMLGQGVCTPLYGIASPLIGKRPMMLSIQHPFYFTLGPLCLGLVVHLLWAALYGVIFGLLARDFHLRGTTAVISGLLYSVLVMLFMSFVVLPIVGFSEMPAMVGWPSFTGEHLLFGIMLGLWPVLRPHDFAVAAQYTSYAATLWESPVRHSPVREEAALLSHTQTGQVMHLEVYVSNQCDNCHEALLIAEQARDIACLEVAVIDVDANGSLVPPSVVAVPTYIFDGQIVSMGNPPREAFLAELRQQVREQ